MYTFRPYTERIARMKDKVRDRIITADSAKMRIQMDAAQKYKNFPPMLQKPYTSLYIIQNMPIDIVEDEYFAGDMGNKGWGAAGGAMWLMVDIENTWPIGEDGLHHAPDDDPLYSHQKLAISPEELKEMRALSAQRMAGASKIFPEEWLPDAWAD